MKKLFARAAASLSGRYRTMSIQMVISLSFTVAAVAGMVLMGLSLVWRYSAGTEQLVRENTEWVLGQVNMNMDSYLRRMMRVSDTMYYRIIKNADLATQSLDEGMELLYEENRDELVSIAVFDSKGALVAGTPLTALKEGADPASSDWYQAALGKMENLHFSTPHIQHLFADPDSSFRWVVSLSRYVQLTREGSTYSGVLLVDMGFSGIEQVCRDVELANGGYIYLTDAAGELIYHPRQQLIYAGLDTENNLAAASLADGTHTETFEGERRLVTVKTVGYTGWKLVGVVPRTGAGDDGHYIFLFGLSMLLFSAFLMAFLNFRISARISDPIRRLEQSVKELEAGAQEVAIREDGCYEVRRLAHSIASMVSTMRHLMDDIILQEKRKRRSELEVLQSQINPHFLYNTLDSVIWMTEAGRYDEAIQMVTSLARLFRIALSRGRSFIPLAARPPLHDHPADPLSGQVHRRRERRGGHRGALHPQAHRAAPAGERHLPRHGRLRGGRAHHRHRKAGRRRSGHRRERQRRGHAPRGGGAPSGREPAPDPFQRVGHRGAQRPPAHPADLRRRLWP